MDTPSRAYINLFVYRERNLMRKKQLPIIVCALLILSIAGYLVFYLDLFSRNNVLANNNTAIASTTSPGAISIDNIGKINNYTYIPPTYEYDNSNSDINSDNKEEQMSDSQPGGTSWTPASDMDLDPKSFTVYVNKEYSLPTDYVPLDLVVPNINFEPDASGERTFMQKKAAQAIENLFAAALEDDCALYAISGYRSYERQKEIFQNNIIFRGKKHTLKYSAAPGTSEHQTGLSMDVSSKSINYKLSTSFAYSSEGKWLADNAYKFGFIIRYPKNQIDLTGYAYEPWHIRYVGEDLAAYLYTKDITLDEYYNYTPSEGFDYEQIYSDLINYRPITSPSPTPIPEEDLTDLESTDTIPAEPLEDKDIEDEALEGEALEDVTLEDETSEDEALEDKDFEDQDSEDESLEEDSYNNPISNPDSVS